MNITTKNAEAAAAMSRADTMTRTAEVMSQGCNANWMKALGEGETWSAERWVEARSAFSEAQRCLAAARRALERLANAEPKDPA